MIDLPAFAAQKCMQAAVSVANVNAREITQPRDVEANMEKIDHVTLLSRPQSFFSITS